MRETAYKKLFTPIQLGNCTLKNRIIFLAHWTNYGNNHGYLEDGLASRRLAMHYIERAKGGAGLVCVTQSVSPTGQMGRTMVNAHDERNEEVFRFMCDEIHKYGGKVFGQFNHCGHTSCMQRPPLLYAPTQMTGPHCYVNTKELEIEEMEEIKRYYAKAAALEKSFGFDGVEIKIAHDGLLRTFASPYLNRRTDRYGGSFENRMRFPIEVIQAIREAVGDEYPIGIRLCMDEFTEWGYSWDYGIRMAKALEEAGVTYINTDAGCFSNYNFEIPNNYIPMGFAVYMSAELKKVLKIPVVAFGRINDPVQAEAILNDGCADMIGMCRQLICDPETPNKAFEGRENEIRHCIACYEGCGMVTDQEGVCCIQNPAAGREERLGIGTIGKTDHPKKVVVVGAGVAGLKAAEIAAKRGHSVVVFEKEAVAGGQLLLAEKIPYRSEHNEVYRYLECELQNLHVPVKFNTEATKELIDQEKPDCVIIATGSHATLPQIPTGEIDMIDPRTAMRNPERIGSRVVMIDRIGYWQAMGVADYVSEMGAEVSIVTKQLFVGVDIVETCRENLNRRLARKGVKSYTSMSLKRIEGKTVVLQNIFNGEECQIKDVDTLIVAQESLSDNSLYYALKADGRYETHVVGDAAAPGTVLRIVFEAETMARRI